jgi:outer membrane protein OmpA-like peptidoglycan-associated protein
VPSSLVAVRDSTAGLDDHFVEHLVVATGAHVNRRPLLRRARALPATFVLALGAFALGALPDCAPAPPRPTYAVADRGVDTDGDGIADVDDACPAEAEDGLPPKANDGCPADDPDQDGIGRKTDQCPSAKEDGLAPMPTDGCPAEDADTDGVADSLDKCPKEREDNVAPDPNDGCPAPDPDKDSIRGALDACPNDPETVNGFEDEDGCPDMVPGTTRVTFDEKSATIYIPDSMRIEFETGSATLTVATKPTIVEVAKVLQAYPQITRVEVEGHASKQGNDQVNLQLTQQRAYAVTQALVAEKVDASRLFPIGYGEYCPAVETADEVDEPRNRRVLVKAVVVNGVWQSVQRGCWLAKRAGADPTQAKPTTQGPPRVIETQGGGV